MVVGQLSIWTGRGASGENGKNKVPLHFERVDKSECGNEAVLRKIRVLVAIAVSATAKV